MLKVKNLRTRHLYHYIVIDPKGEFVGSIKVMEKLKDTPPHAQIVITNSHSHLFLRLR